MCPDQSTKQMIRDKTSHLGINLIQAACAPGSFHKCSILEQHSHRSSSAYPELQLKYSNRNKNNSPESRWHSCFRWRIITEVSLKAGIRDGEIPPLTPTEMLMTSCMIVLKQSFQNLLFPRFMVSQLLAMTRLSGRKQISWTVRRSNHISPGAAEFSLKV